MSPLLFEIQQPTPILSSLLALEYYCRAEQLRKKRLSVVKNTKFELQEFQREIQFPEYKEASCIEIISQLPLQIGYASKYFIQPQASIFEAIKIGEVVESKSLFVSEDGLHIQGIIPLELLKHQGNFLQEIRPFMLDEPLPNMQSNLKQLYEYCSKYQLSHIPLVNGDRLCIGYFTYSEILKKYVQFSTHASAAVFREVLAQETSELASTSAAS